MNQFNQEFALLLRACYPLIYIPSQEEERVEKSITEIGPNLGNRQVYIWDFVDGYQDNPNNANVGRRNPLQALEFIEKLPPNVGGIFVLRDFQRFLEDVSISRKLRNLSRTLKAQPKNVVVIAPEINIPSELKEVFTITEFPLPQAEEIKQEIQRLLSATRQSLSEQFLDELVRSAQGLSLERIRRVLTRAIAFAVKDFPVP